MKISRVIAVIIVLAILIQGYLLLTKKKDEPIPPPNEQTQEQPTPEPEPPADQTAEPVSTTKISQNNVRYINALGTVKASEQAKILPIITGQIKKVYVNEGDAIKAGDVLFEIGGFNGGKALATSQLEIAKANYDSAQENLQNTITGNESGLKIAQLQLESAQHQVMGSYLDLDVFNHNINTINYGTYLLESTFGANQFKNALDVQKAQMGIRQLQDALNQLLQQQQMVGESAELNAKINELASQLNSLQISYQTLDQASIMGNNQILGQWAQSDNQSDVLALNQQSMKYKLGLFNGTSDPLRIAEESLNATYVKNAAVLNQAETAVKLAKANLDMAKQQADGLKVKAPIEGIVGDVMVHEGDQVAPQVLLTSITSGQNFEVKVPVNISNAEKVKWDLSAEVEIGGRFIKVPIRGISPNADPSTKLVNVTLALPKIFFRNNQTLKTRIPLADGAKQGSFYIPLDAVIIGTEEQYVFVVQDGKAVKVNLKLGVIEGDQAQVLEGLNENDEVIVEGAKNLIDGQEVEINN